VVPTLGVVGEAFALARWLHLTGLGGQRQRTVSLLVPGAVPGAITAAGTITSVARQLWRRSATPNPTTAETTIVAVSISSTCDPALA
jgi:hypothetical protein